jgi:outer membrane murein-binding lipoprotein Lpp
MSRVINAILILVILIVIGYGAYNYSLTPCDTVLEYSIGRFDSNFGLSREQFANHLTQAEAVWEGAAGKNLFEYDPRAQFTVNLIYDSRQRATVERQRTESGLAAAENILKTLDANFNEARIKYENEVAALESAKAALENRGAEYQSEVNYWNSRGGAPREKFNELEAKRKSLNSEVASLNSRTNRINIMASELNHLLNDRNRAASEYNKTVEIYNKKYGTHASEFSQAEYLGDSINIYQYNSSRSLVAALTHELGHALDMEHVENPSSIMFYLREGESGASQITPSKEDLTELKRVCPNLEI